MTNVSFAAEFPPTDAAAWRSLVETALKGADFDKRLVSRSYDGLRVEPLYPRVAGVHAVAGRAGGEPWQVMARTDHPDAAEANKQALLDLENGATGLSLVFAGALGAYGYGLDGSEATIARALENVWLDAVAIETDFSAQQKDAGLNLAKAVKARGIDPAKTQIRFAHDPLGLMARNGAAPRPWAETAKLLAGFAADLAGQGFKGPFAVADGRAVHAAGGSEAQELAFALGNAVAYLRMFVDAGVPLDQARKLIFFRLAADADEFMTIAKSRALRKLWARVEEASGLTPQPAFVSAETAWRMMTQRDPYVNMLRTTIAITAAGLGGADSISVLPFTAARGLPDAFARRVARNQQLILLEESNLYRVADPAAGSGGIEALTTQLAQTAWSLFQDIEKAGGAAAAIEHGLMQKKVAETRKAHEANVARRKEPLTGATEFPHLGESDVKVLDASRVTVPPLTAAITFDALPQIRLAEPFEALRDKSDAIARKSGSRPKVFLANLGKLSEFTTRAGYAKNFYEAGGIEAIGSDGYKDQAEMLAAFRKSGTNLACICSSDKVYEAEAVAAAKALAEAGATIHLAGRPGELEAILKEAGVRTFIYVGCDVLSTLQTAYDSLVAS
ncbi:methylmalonyl-CoA mutase [Pseudolabrys sp. Root1462]|uniref:methylmalonyl-CoA mutase subunit beta n=1 Tax=Pseudolabrys sp. Root1462 TaxID=1736466 RepID=UPI0007030CEF|nr:methylmalonyl-CoA mutase subunit beta [Pseudolabrys sp. Root1462]KQZ01709.1 methylmalonyl-CoA mutase [Pseudolabrys sp. Root1462]